MRIYKTRADFDKLIAAQNPAVFAGTVCTITDEVANPMYVFQEGSWNSLVTATTNPLTGRIENNGIPVEKIAGHVFACLGDSISYQNTNGSMLSLRAQGYMTWAVVLSGGRIVFNPQMNFGVAGENSTQVAARVGSVVTAAPEWCVVHCGTNDLYVGPVAYETTIENLKTIYSTLLNAGIRVVAMPIIPRAKDGASGSLPTAERQKIQRVNNWIRRIAALTPGIVLADPSLNIVDHSVTNGDPIGASTAAATAHTTDGLHPAPRGAFYMGKSIADAVSSHLCPLSYSPVSQIDTFDATNNPTGNIAANGFFTGTGGTAGTGASGTLAASWQFRRSSGTTGTIVGSKTTKTVDNGTTYPVQQVVCSATAGSSTENLQVYQFISSNFTAGVDTVYAEMEIEVSGVTVDCVRSIQLNLGDGTNTAICAAEQVGFYLPNGNWSGTLRTPEFLIASGATSLGLYLNIVMNGSVASNSVTVNCSRAAVRKVF